MKQTTRPHLPRQHAQRRQAPHPVRTIDRSDPQGQGRRVCRCRYKGYVGMHRWVASASSPTIWSTSGALSRTADNPVMSRPSASPWKCPGSPLVIIYGQFVIDRSPEQAAVPGLLFVIRARAQRVRAEYRLGRAASDRRNERDDADPADSVPAVGQKAARTRERKRSAIVIRAM
jgi:hypothetical protein